MANETGWVIEHGGSLASRPQYWTGSGWSFDHLEAVRCARRVDAERMLIGIGGGALLPNAPTHRVAEHVWG